MHIMRSTMLMTAVVALATIGTASTAFAATPASSSLATHQAPSADHVVAASNATRVNPGPATLTPSGACVFFPPYPALYTFIKGGIASCLDCLQEGQDGENEGFWENFECWDPGSGDAWQLWVIDGPS